MANTTNWLSISSQSGSSGQTILTLSANKNLSAGTKTAEVTAYNPVYNISAKTYVTIDAYSPYIYVSDSIIGIPASGGTYQLGIESNCSFVIAYPNMVSTYSTSAGTGNISVTFSVPATYQSQTITENIVITDESGQYSIVIRLEQYGSEPEISAVPPELLFEANGGTLYFTVSANCVYHIDNSVISGWCGVSPQSGYTGSTTFTVTTTANTGDSAKTGIIAVVGPGTAGDMVQVRQKRTTVQIPYTADTSTIEASGETRTITIDTTGLVDSSITVDIQNAPGATYTYSNGVITLTIPDNAGLQRDIVVSVTGKTTGGDDAATSITFTQAEHTTVQIPYTADTSTVDASGETRTITIDTTGLIASSITIGVEGATGVTYTYNNGVVTVVFPDNSGSSRNITVNVTGQTINGNSAVAAITYIQSASSSLLGQYLTFNILEGGKISWYSNRSGFSRTIQYSKNGGSWTNLIGRYPGQYGPDPATGVTVEAGDIIQFRGDNTEYGGRSSWRWCHFGFSSAKFNIEGNIMSLISSTNFANLTTVSGEAFLHIFNDTKVVSAHNLLLPATTIGSHCYRGMFEGCTLLTTAPAILPAMTLAGGCYAGMFQGCTSLTTAPALPATVLKRGCYTGMFAGCTSLTTAPALPATAFPPSMGGGGSGAIAGLGCYEGMFSGCTALTTVPAFKVESLSTASTYCFQKMFSGCTNLTGVSIDFKATTLPDMCCSGMFKDCSSLLAAPDISASTVGWESCREMFTRCISLRSAPRRLAQSLYVSSYRDMFYGCSSLTTAPELPATTLTSHCYDSMFNGCTSLNYIKCLATDISAGNCTSNWVKGVASTGTFVKNPNMSSWATGDSGIPSGWTVKNA